MAVELAAGYISTYPKLDESKTRAAGKDLEHQLERAGDEGGRKAGDSFAGAFGGGIKKAVAVAAAAFAGLEVGKYIGDAISAASDLGETTAKVGQIFGDWSIDVDQFAGGAAKSLGQSKQSALDAAATFGVFGKSAGLAGGDLFDFSKQMVGLSTDLASFANTSPEEAIEAIGAALRGESEPIRRYGVLLDDATLKNRAMALGLIATTKDALTPQQRVLAAQAEILAQTSDAQGDFARTSDGLANQQRILRAELENGKAALGELFLPAATAVVTFLNNEGIPAFRDFSGRVKESISEIVDAFNGVGDLGGTIAVEIGKWMGWAEDDARVARMAAIFDLVEVQGAKAFTALRDAARDSYDAVVKIIGYVVDHQDAFSVAAGGALGFAGALGAIAAANQAATVLGSVGSSAGLLGRLLPILTTPAGLLVVALAAIAAAAYIAYQKFEPFRNVVDTVAGVVRDVALAAFDRFKGLLEELGPVVERLAGFFATARDRVGEIAGKAQGVGEQIIGAFAPLVAWINDNLLSTFAAAGGAVAGFAEFALGVLGPFVETWKQILGPILDFVVNLLGDIKGAWEEFDRVVSPLVSGIWQGLVTIIETVFGVAKDVVEGILGNIRGLFQIFEGIFRGDWSKIWEGLNTILDATLGNAVQIVERILGGVREAVGRVLGGVEETARRALSGAVNWLYDAGRDIIQGLVDGIWDAIPDVQGALSRVTNLIPDWKGPERVDKLLLRPSGRWLLEGLQAGIGDELPALRVQLAGVTGLVRDAVPVSAPAVASVASTPAPSPAGVGVGGVEVHMHLEGANLMSEMVPDKVARAIQRALSGRERAGR